MNSNNTTSEMSDEEFDKMLDEHFSDDLSVKRSINAKMFWESNPDRHFSLSEEMKKRNADSEFQKINLERLQKQHADPQFQKRHSERHSKRMEMLHKDLEFQKRKKYRDKKPVKTREGIFDSVISWSKITKHNKTTFYDRKKKYPTEYYYITWEEYERLKNNEN